MGFGKQERNTSRLAVRPVLCFFGLEDELIVVDVPLCSALDVPSQISAMLP
jgi:hypothetical protein